MRKFLTVTEVADGLQVTRFTVYRYIYEELFPAVKLKGSWRIEEESFERFLNSRMMGK